MACFSSSVPPVGVYLVKFAPIAENGCLLDVLRRRKVRFACAKIHYVDTFAAQTVGRPPQLSWSTIR